MHGHDLLGVENIHFYQNTILCRPLRFTGDLLRRNRCETMRSVLNNVILYLQEYLPSTPDTWQTAGNILMDGNLHWCPVPGVEPPTDYLEPPRQAVAQGAVCSTQRDPLEAHSQVADPRFVRFSLEPAARNDYRLQSASPAVGAGVVLPGHLPDPWRPPPGTLPDVGALPVDEEPFRVGRSGRYSIGEAVAQLDARRE